MMGLIHRIRNNVHVMRAYDVAAWNENCSLRLLSSRICHSYKGLSKATENGYSYYTPFKWCFLLNVWFVMFMRVCV